MLNLLIVPHSPSWRREFSDLQHVLSNALQAFEVDIQHVGSTAVPGLAAKPVLDIDIVLVQGEQLPQVSATLEQLGYRAAGTQGIPGRYAFKQPSMNVPVATSSDSPASPKKNWLRL